MLTNFENNIINHSGDAGRQWLAQLPHIVKHLSFEWALTNVIPVDNMSWNFIVLADSVKFGKVCLKIGIDSHLICEESKALKFFDGQAMVRLISCNSHHNALLLEQIIPGKTLKQVADKNVNLVFENYVHIIDTLQDKATTFPTPDFKSVRDWFMVFDHLPLDALPDNFIPKAKKLSEILLSKSGSQVFLHGDLHLDNILSNKDSWVAIDPKRVIGPKEFEMAAFDFLSPQQQTRTLLVSRVHQIAYLAKIDPQVLLGWVFVRLVLKACWMLEDNGDPAPFLNQLSLIQC